MDTTFGILILLVILFSARYILYIYRVIYILSIKIFKLKPIDLKQKYGDWAVVTGSTDGIGKAYAVELAKRNINLVIISRSLNKLEKTKSELESLNPSIKIKIIIADFSKGLDEYERIKSELSEIPVGILVNNVGKLTAHPMYFDEISENDVWSIIDINIHSVTVMTHMLIKDMLKRKKGAIVNISSSSNLVPVPLMSIYSSTKIYGRYLSESLQTEYSKSGLTIQCLAPFFVNTNMVNFDVLIQNRYYFPNAKVYAENAIETLGRLDYTTGYWMHELQELISLLPKWLCIRILLLVNLNARNKIMNSEKQIN